MILGGALSNSGVSGDFLVMSSENPSSMLLKAIPTISFLLSMAESFNDFPQIIPDAKPIFGLRSCLPKI